MSTFRPLLDQGQAIWYDYFRRSLITSGELQGLLDEGITGIISSPSILARAVSGSADYDEALKRVAKRKKSAHHIYEMLALEDVSQAADLLRPVYDASHGGDGYVSMDVSPALAGDAEGIVTEGKRLFETVSRPNLMIKVPATEAALPAITELTACGVNVNVTLIFSPAAYRAVAEAYISGLDKLVAAGRSLEHTASVASFNVSRIDTALDLLLAARNQPELQGKTAIAGAKLVHASFQAIFSGERWERLVEHGARVQRPLWTSTATRNPQYPDTLYVESLIGPQSVCAMAPATLNSFRDHGRAAAALSQGRDDANAQMADLGRLGIDLEAVARELLAQGVAASTKSFEALLAGISAKRERLVARAKVFTTSLGDSEPAVDSALSELRDNLVMTRIWSHDHTLWKPDPKEIANRLGWLHSPENVMDALPEIDGFVEGVLAAGLTHALLLGMGGSSLAPEVFRKTFGVGSHPRTGQAYVDLAVLDSTDPGAVLAYDRQLDPGKTLFIVSTKSGGTVETFSFFRYFYNRVLAAVGSEEVGNHFVAITDPGSGLADLARELKFRKTFLNDPNIGGRYSALSYFGIVPAALTGVDVHALLERAAVMACNCEASNCPVSGDNTGARLGAIMGELAVAGRDKVTFICSPPIASFGAWAEQLIAESTGKEGKGILPVEGEMLGSPADYATDRLFVHLRLEADSTHDARVQALIDAGRPVVQIHLRDLYALGGEFFRWEVATIIAGRRLGVNPFDQPNVESAKVLARNMVAAFQNEGKLPELTPSLSEEGLILYADRPAPSISAALQDFFAQADAGDERGSGRSYVALQAYVKPATETDEALHELRTKIQTSLHLAATVGYGPRFLHSTGQLHKGDAGHGLFIQLTANMPEDVPIPDRPGEPDSSISFGILKTAQALGDRQALLDNHRRVIRVDLGMDVAACIKKLVDMLG